MEIYTTTESGTTDILHISHGHKWENLTKHDSDLGFQNTIIQFCLKSCFSVDHRMEKKST